MSFEILYENHVEGLELQDRKQEIEQLLKNHICEVTFTKVDGSLRTMSCTMDSSRYTWTPTSPKVKPAASIDKLDPNKIDMDSLMEVKTARKKPEYNLSVWCMDNQAWRSFKVANVTHVRVVDGN